MLTKTVEKTTSTTRTKRLLLQLMLLQTDGIKETSTGTTRMEFHQSAKAKPLMLNNLLQWSGRELTTKLELLKMLDSVFTVDTSSHGIAHQDQLLQLSRPPWQTFAEEMDNVKTHHTFATRMDTMNATIKWLPNVKMNWEPITVLNQSLLTQPWLKHSSKWSTQLNSQLIQAREVKHTRTAMRTSTKEISQSQKIKSEIPISLLRHGTSTMTNTTLLLVKLVQDLLLIHSLPLYGMLKTPRLHLPLGTTLLLHGIAQDQANQML